MTRRSTGKAAMTVTLEGRAAEMLADLCAASGHDPQTLFAVLIEDHFDEDMAEIRELKRRLARVDAGHFVTHEEAKRRIRAAMDGAGRDAASLMR